MKNSPEARQAISKTLLRRRGIRMATVGKQDREFSWLFVEDIGRACNEFFRSRGLPITDPEYHIRNH